MDKLLISNVSIVKMNDNKEIIERGNIYIEGGKIVGLDRHPRQRMDFVPDRVIDGRGQVALPGLVNAHTHLAMTLLRGYADDMKLERWLRKKIWPTEANLRPEDVYWGSMLGIAEMIRSGTTSFADMYFYPEETARAVAESGIRASVCGVLIGILPNALEWLEEAVRFAKRYHGVAEGRMTTMLGPHAIYTCPADILEKVREKALELGVGIHIHLAETAAEVREIMKKYKRRPVQVLGDLGLFDCPVLAAHGVYLDDEDIKLLKKGKVAIVHSPGSNLKLASGIAPVPKLLKAGITVALGTDGAASNNNLDMFEEMRLTALVHKVYSGDPTVVSAYEALEMGTRGGAKALGLEGEIGVIEEGYKADIILVDFQQAHLCPAHNIISHLVYSARGSDVSTVIVAGKILMEKGKLVTIDEDRVMAEAQRHAGELIKK